MSQRIRIEIIQTLSQIQEKLKEAIKLSESLPDEYIACATGIDLVEFAKRINRQLEWEQCGFRTMRKRFNLILH